MTIVLYIILLAWCSVCIDAQETTEFDFWSAKQPGPTQVEQYKTKSGCIVNTLSKATYGCPAKFRLNWKPFISGKPKRMDYQQFCQLQCQQKLLPMKTIDKNWKGCKGWIWTGSECILKQCDSDLQAESTKFSATATSGVYENMSQCTKVIDKTKNPTIGDSGPVSKVPTMSPTAQSVTEDGYFEGPKMPKGKKPPNRYNFVIMVADDMSSVVWPYIENTHVMRDATPSLNRLMDTSTVFFNTYSQFSVCGPSRQSMMSGRMPDTLKIYNFERWLPQAHPAINTIGKYFIKNGYDVRAIGKIFHDNSKHFFGSMWSDLGHFSGPVLNHNPEGNIECGTKWYCELDTNQLVDAVSTNLALKYLRGCKAIEYDQTKNVPFMLMLGFRRPHITVAVPRSVRERIDVNAVDSPNRDTPVPESNTKDFTKSLAYYECSSELSEKTVLKNGAWIPIVTSTQGLSVLNQPQNEDVVKSIRSYYYRSINWIDSKVGLILDQLEESNLDGNTVVIFMSDHGFSNGDHGMWCKNSLYEQVLRVPLVVRVPGIMGGVRNRKTMISLTDVLPTLIDLAGLPPFDDGTGIQLDGKSFLPALREPSRIHSAAAYSQYPRCQTRGTTQSDACIGSIVRPGEVNTCDRNPILYMGYSIRVLGCRYTEWRNFQEVRTGCTFAAWEGIPPKYVGGSRYQQIDQYKTGTVWSDTPFERELYCDYDSDEAKQAYGNWEKVNLAVNPTASNVKLMNNLSNMIKEKFQNYNEVCNGRGIYDIEKSICTCISGWSGKQCEITI